MKFSEIKQYKIVISLALIFLVLAGSVIIYIAYSQPEELQKPPQQDLQPIPGQSPVPSSTTESLHYDYCIIEEVHPDFVDPNATIVHLSSDDLEPFPEYQKQMADESKLSKKWRDGHRFIGDFIDFQRQFDDFRNLTCNHSPDPMCNPRQSSVYEYNGRYFTVGCLPDFGGKHQNLPPPRK
ncbi:MAG: hypothetical protein M0R30_05180 [Methanoregula sp.]|jgi:hypothetical protein|uniref:hypothetical protein n=1 Tax=Methanoregula sp. TaxID=2052170 RepID=UPI0025E9881A|nr:hypothetical protein [Methanoregula sp.]MCK9631016.1 hypothetical protein [Methanoregula sp.]